MGLRNTVEEEGRPRPPLGRRLASRFASFGLTGDIPEWRGQPARPAEA